MKIVLVELFICIWICIQSINVCSLNTCEWSAFVDFSNPACDEILAREGILEIQNIPGLEKLRQNVFHDVLECVRNGQGLEKKLADGSKRTTIGGLVEDGLLSPLVILEERCEALVESNEAFRKIISRASNVFSDRLSSFCGENGIPDMRVLENESGVRRRLSMDKFIATGTQLEHFHVYEPTCNPSNKLALDLHTDEGLFIAITAPIWSRDNTILPDAVSGFKYINSEGKEIEPIIKPNSIVFMMGDGFKTWFPRCSNIRAVPHALALPKDMCAGERTWYGRMFMPPHMAVHETLGVSFRELRNHNMDASEGLRVGCASGASMRDLAGTCPEGTMYCWMGCRTVSPNCDPSQQICEGTSGNETGTIWDPTSMEHCMSCKPMCPGEIPVVGSICNGLGTDMNMAGFVSGVNPINNCVVLLFETWMLDTRVKFAFGCIGSFVLAFAIEVLQYYREEELNKRGWYFYIPLLVIQITLGYYIMLIVMTYCIELFISVVSGLVLGHSIFSRKATVQKSTDPCCQFMDDGH